MLEWRDWEISEDVESRVFNFHFVVPTLHCRNTESSERAPSFLQASQSNGKMPTLERTWINNPKPMEDNVFAAGRPNEWEVGEDRSRFHLAQNVLILRVHKESSAESWKTVAELSVPWSSVSWSAGGIALCWGGEHWTGRSRGRRMLSFILDTFSWRCLKDIRVKNLRKLLCIWDKRKYSLVILFGSCYHGGDYWNQWLWLSHLNNGSVGTQWVL